MHEGYLARKLGLGEANPRDIDISPEDYVDEQLALPIQDLALRSSEEQTKTVEPWPEKFERPLKQQWRDEDQFQSEMGRLSDGKNASPSEIEALNRLGDSLSWYHREADAYQLIVTNIYSQNHVTNRLNIFWSNHFTVAKEHFVGDFIFSSKRLLNSNFKELLYHSIKHPAMTRYLDNWTNVGPRSEVVLECKRDGGRDCDGMNDNLARELLELHTVSPARGYTEKDIHETAKVLTGWGRYLPGSKRDRRAPIEENWVRRAAEPGNKMVLGKRISWGKKGLRELTDFLAEDPMTIEHLSRKLLRHFCGDPVDDGDVAAVAKVWMDTDGHLPAVHREVLIRAAYKPDQKFLWPLVWAWQVMRVTGGHPFMGVEQAFKDIDERLTRRFPSGNHGPNQFFQELGMDVFVEGRTPDGFSEDKADWVSNEHMDRRLRFSEWVYKRAADDAEGSRLTPAEIAERQRFSAKTVQIASNFGNDKTFYQLLMCSPEMMEV